MLLPYEVTGFQGSCNDIFLFSNLQVTQQVKSQLWSRLDSLCGSGLFCSAQDLEAVCDEARDAAMEATNEILRKRREGSDLATLIVDRWLLWIFVFSASPRRTLSLPGYVPLQRGLRGRKVIRVEFNLIGEPHNNKITIFRGIGTSWLPRA